MLTTTWDPGMLFYSLEHKWLIAWKLFLLNVDIIKKNINNPPQGIKAKHPSSQMNSLIMMISEEFDFHSSYKKTLESCKMAYQIGRLEQAQSWNHLSISKRTRLSYSFSKGTGIYLCKAQIHSHHRAPSLQVDSPWKLPPDKSGLLAQSPEKIKKMTMSIRAQNIAFFF